MQSTQITSDRFRFIVKENYSVDLEYNQDFVIIHLPHFAKLTKGVFKDIRNTLEGLSDFVRTTTAHEALWVAVAPEDSKLQKFVTKLGFEYRGSADNQKVYERTI